jgi:hypothetical protein
MSTFLSVQFLIERTCVSPHSQPRGVGKVQEGEPLSGSPRAEA